MFIPSYKNIIYTDYPDQYKDLVSLLGQNINDAFNVCYKALAKKITLVDNMQGGLVTVSVKVDSNGNPLTKTTFQIDSSIQTLDGFQVIKALNTTSNSVYTTGCPFISYTQQSSNIILVNNISGLPANNTFQLTVMAYGH